MSPRWCQPGMLWRVTEGPYEGQWGNAVSGSADAEYTALKMLNRAEIIVLHRNALDPFDH